jgi:hypothetical protein
MKIKFYSTVILVAFINATAFTQSNKNTPPALSAITEADLNRDLYADSPVGVPHQPASIWNAPLPDIA